MAITLLEGDITAAKVDVIVNAANSSLLGGGGVDGAIHRAAGPGLLAECKTIPVINGQRCPTGEARITGGGNLPAKYVIHTVGPIYHQVDSPAHLLRECFVNSLQLAEQHQCKSIAFPAISCGVYAYPPEEAAVISINTCRELAPDSMAISFYLFNYSMLSIWQRAL